MLLLPPPLPPLLLLELLPLRLVLELLLPPLLLAVALVPLLRGACAGSDAPRMRRICCGTAARTGASGRAAWQWLCLNCAMRVLPSCMAAMCLGDALEREKKACL